MRSNRQYLYYDCVVTASVAILLCANLIGPAKLVSLDLPLLGAVTMSAGTLFLPLFYACGKIVSEVYGPERNHRVIWLGFAALAFAATMSACLVALSPAVGPANAIYQQHLQAVFGNAPRIAAASMIAFLAGSFVNNHAMTALKAHAGGRHLMLRMFGSSLCTQLVDVSLFYLIAFCGDWPGQQLLNVIVAQYLLKIMCEFLMAPVCCSMVRLLKKLESGALSSRDIDAPALDLSRPLWQAAKNG
jgi:queuosine precursor transporter